MKNTKLWAIVLLGLFLSVVESQAQILKPVKWEYGYKKINDQEAVIFIKASIQPGWHIYAMNVPKDGPTKTEFFFNPSKDYQLMGKTLQPAPLSKFEDVFDMDVPYFKGTVTFQQKIKLVSANPKITGRLSFMVCDETQCLPEEEIEFAINIK